MFLPIRKKIYSILESNKENRFKYEAIKICLIYIVIGFLWIYLSERIAHKLASSNVMLLIISTYKGWLYVAVTATILYLLMRNLIKKVDLGEKKLTESYEELAAVNEELEAYVQQLTTGEEELRYQYDQLTESEKKLRKSEERYKNLVTKMHQGLAIYEAIVNDKEEIIDYRFLDSNESYERMTGLKKEDILGKTVSQIFPSIGKSVIEKFGHVVKTGEPVCYENYLHEIDKHYEALVYRPKKLQIAIIATDITVRKQAEEGLKTSENNFRNIFEGSSDAIFLDDGTKVIDCNLAMVELLGYDSKVSLLGKYIGDFSPEKQPCNRLSREKALELHKCAMKNGKCKFEWWYKRVDGKVLPVEVVMTTMIYNGKKVFHYIWRDISERKQMEDKLEYLSYHDQLTGLFNRRFFEEQLNMLDDERNYPLSIIMADVNGLKLVNDSFGHAMGDDLIKKVVEVIKNGCRNEDIVARVGGDEFVILLPKTDTYQSARIVKRIKDLSSKEKVGSLDTSISLGYDTKNNKEEKIQDILKKAEDHMYKKKLFESPSIRGKTISAIIRTLHEKNKREEQHSHRVSKLCESMGKALGLLEDEIKELETVGLLHDIGKIAIEENILNKPGKLTDEEWEELKRHPEIGYRILSTVNDMSEMAEYVLAHHERWDGGGYPKGLKGEETPLQSRIIAIADAYDAMISERSYRGSLSEEVAIGELRKNAGMQFDPELVKVFVEKVLNRSFN